MIVEVVKRLIITLPLFCVCNVEERRCNSSLHTQRVTDHCPRNEDEFERRDNKFNCSFYPQNCTSQSSFSYHCVPNAWRNASVEVCAIATTIVGSTCAEFNYGGKMVQEHNKGKCSSCPFRYPSTEAYKYRECYSHEKDQSPKRKNITGNVNSNDTVLSNNESSKCNVGCPDADPDVNVRWVAVILAFISAIVFVVSIIRIYKRTHWNPRKDTNKMVESPNIQGCYEKTEEGKRLLNHTENTDHTKTGIPEDAIHKGYFSPNRKTPVIPAHDISKSFTSLHEPEYPIYLTFSIRLLSFSESEFPLTDKTEELANAGFFYEGFEVCTQCFQCGCRKQDWKSDDNALLEHLRLNSNCSFVLSIKKGNEGVHNNE
ncbi:uncharacterized protein LOC130052800 [Ostrea edulis]|uniref:uncharacterized protein LOC130052800 n=1 Tax=Ostrea edulis TaxID=37623 RepID=UPI0024AEB253|nr:uncharacterized protein LOC130052800 [Ostrea edulis]